MVLNKEKVFRRFKEFWNGQGIRDINDPKFIWILNNNPESILYGRPQECRLSPNQPIKLANDREDESVGKGSDANVLFIWPGVRLAGWNAMHKGASYEAVSMNHGLSDLSAMLKDSGYTTSLLDFRRFKSEGEVEARIKALKYTVACVGFHSVDEEPAKLALHICKKYHPNDPTIIGGPHVTVTQTTNFPNADCIVHGEGDLVLVEMVKEYIENNKWPSALVKAPVIKDLSILPPTDRTLFPVHLEMEAPFLPLLPPPFFTINFSRGCWWGRCTFCHQSNIESIFKHYRTRPPINCITEIERLMPRSLMVHDDIFPSKAWSRTFVDQWVSRRLPRIPFWCQMRADFIANNPMIIKDLADIGLTWVSLGVESGSQKILDFLDKGTLVEENLEAVNILHDNNVNIFMDLVFGLPEETQQDINDTVELVKKTRPHSLSLSTYTCYPNSKLYNYIIEHDLFLNEHYSMTRYPYERKVKGVDYHAIQKAFSIMNQYKGELRHYVKKPDSLELTDNAFSSMRGVVPFAQALTIRDNMDETPNTSIIIISHDRPVYLVEAVGSLLQQTDKSWEAVILETSTTSGPLLALNTIQDKRLRVFSVKSDNISQLWNIGIELSKGKYIALLDDDNRKKPKFVQRLSQYLDDHLDVDAVVCQWVNINSDGKVWNNAYRLPEKFDIEKLLKKNDVDSGSMMFRKDVVNRIGWFDERLHTSEDWDFTLRIISEGMGFGILQEVHNEYRLHQDRRMTYDVRLGRDRDIEALRAKPHRAKISIATVTPLNNQLTESQRDALRGIITGMMQYPTAEIKVMDYQEALKNCMNYDFAFIIFPMMVPESAIKGFLDLAIPVVSIHIEEPQGFDATSPKLKYLSKIVVNDSIVVDKYEQIVGHGNVFIWNNLGINYTELKDIINTDVERDLDVVFLGYPYHSRVKFVDNLGPEVIRMGLNFTCIGNGWGNRSPAGVKCHETMSDVDTMKMLKRTKIVICYDREVNDLPGPTIAARNIHRGYFECGSGALVLIHNDNKKHSFNGEVEFFDNVSGCIRLIKQYINNLEERAKIGNKAKAKAIKDWTFETRMMKIINAVKSQRFGVWVE